MTAGTGLLLRLALRRDRVWVAAWLGGLVVVALASVAAIDRFYPSGMARRALAASVTANPGLRALTGPLFDTSTGALVAWRVTGTLAVLLALLNLLLVVRHSRGDEEQGRTELVGATAVARPAPLVAALVTAALTDLVLAGALAAGLPAVGLPRAGSVAFALGLAAVGWFFAGVAALTAQAVGTGRGAAGLAGGVLGLAYLLRAGGDSGSGTLSWASPIGWAQQVRPFAVERWWVLLLPLLGGMVLAATALAVAGRRDLGARLLPERTGPAYAGPWLSSPLALAWRLQRGPLLGWAVGLLALGAAVGALQRDIAAVLRASPQVLEVLRRLAGGADPVDAFLAGVLALVGLLLGGYAVQAALRPRGEEVALRAEPLLATAVSRRRWLAGHLCCAWAGTVLLALGTGLALGVVSGLRGGDLWGGLPRLLSSTVVQLPAAWVLGGLALALVGLAPRAVALAWAVLGAAVLLGQLGEVFQLPGWLLDLSPFRHTPALPAAPLRVMPLALLTGLAAGLTVAGLLGVRRRDLG